MNLKSGKNALMENSWHKYGEHNFKFEVLELCSRDQLLVREIFWFEKLQTHFKSGGFNLVHPRHNPNGPNPISEATKEKMSEAKAEKYHAFGLSLSLRAWSKRTGIPKDTIRFRLRRGYSIEQAVSNKVHHTNLTVGCITGTIPQLARHFEIPPSRVKNRLAANWCPTKAFLLPAQR